MRIYPGREQTNKTQEKQQMIDETSEIIVDAKTLVDPHEQRLQTFRAIQAEDLAHLKAVLKDFYPRTTTVGPAKRMRTELLNFIESEEQHSNISISPIGNDAVSVPQFKQRHSQVLTSLRFKVSS
jgi:hypothetical protein